MSKKNRHSKKLSLEARPTVELVRVSSSVIKKRKGLKRPATLYQLVPKRVSSNSSSGKRRWKNRKPTIYDLNSERHNGEVLGVITNLWSQKDVQKGNLNFEVDKLLLSSNRFHRKKSRKAAIEKSIRYLEEIPPLRTTEQQSHILNIIGLITPLANEEQLRRLESVASLEAKRLYLALEEQNHLEILSAGLMDWTPNMIRLLDDYDMDFLTVLTTRWASLQPLDICLRNDDALSRFLKRWLPLSKFEGKSTFSFLKHCCREWNNINDELMSLLSHVQAALPVQEAENLPMLLFTVFFRFWATQCPKPKKLIRYISNPDPENKYRQKLEIPIQRLLEK